METHPCILAKKFHKQRNLAGYSPLGCKESSTTWRLNDRSNNILNYALYDIKNSDRMNVCVYDGEVHVKRCGPHPCGSQRVLALLSFPFPGPKFYVHHVPFFLCF